MSLYIHTGVFRHAWAHHTLVGMHVVPYTPLQTHTHTSIHTWPHPYMPGHAYRTINTYQQSHGFTHTWAFIRVHTGGSAPTQGQTCTGIPLHLHRHLYGSIHSHWSPCTHTPRTPLYALPAVPQQPPTPALHPCTCAGLPELPELPLLGISRLTLAAATATPPPAGLLARSLRGAVDRGKHHIKPLRCNQRPSNLALGAPWLLLLYLG